MKAINVLTIDVHAVVRQSNNVKFPKILRPMECRLTMAEKVGTMMVLLPEGHSQYNSMSGRDNYVLHRGNIQLHKGHDVPVQGFLMMRGEKWY